MSRENKIEGPRRNRGGSRSRILCTLSAADGWIPAEQALGECTPEGPWSEDLQDLVREGLVEAEVPPEAMSNTTLVRLAGARDGS